MIGARNVYVCPTQHYTVTVDMAEGTTPMMIRCPHHMGGGQLCSQMARSKMYPNVPPNEWPRPSHAWDKPTKSERKRDKAYYAGGALALRTVTDTEPLPPPRPLSPLLVPPANQAPGVMVRRRHDG